jgi:hypothetical protein
MRYQSRSEVPKNGEPEDHQLAVTELQKWFFVYRHNDTMAIKDFKIRFNQEFIDKHKLDYTFHKYDLAVLTYPFKPSNLKDGKYLLGIYEVGQDYDDIVTLPDKRKLHISKSKHSKHKQTINDQISEDYIRENYPETKYFKIDKSDCFNPEILNNICSQVM